jgi:NTE family protein
MTVVYGPRCDPKDASLDQSFESFHLCRAATASAKGGVALALGGGFSRGFAHLGVLEVLEQEGIPIAGIAGTSIGGLLGAAYADGISIRELCRFGRRVRIRDFFRFRTPSRSTETNDRIGQFVRDWFHSKCLEELSIPTAIVATDLEACAPHVFARGPLDIAIRASCAFPGLFAPIEHEGRLLADGCIAAPVPTDVASWLNASCVLGVIVSSNGSDAGSSHKERGSLSSSWRRKADIILEPDVQHLGWRDFSRVDDAHAAGVAAMRRELPKLRELLARWSPRQPVATAFSQPRSRGTY